MRNYQSKKDNPYQIPHNLYMRILYVIRDYERMKLEYSAQLGKGAPALDGLPKGKRLADPTAQAGIRLAVLSTEIGAVEDALARVPEEYREYLFDYICRGAKLPDFAHYNTWRYWKYRIMYYTAKNLNLI